MTFQHILIFIYFCQVNIRISFPFQLIPIPSPFPLHRSKRTINYNLLAYQFLLYLSHLIFFWLLFSVQMIFLLPRMRRQNILIKISCFYEGFFHYLLYYGNLMMILFHSLFSLVIMSERNPASKTIFTWPKCKYKLIICL